MAAALGLPEIEDLLAPFGVSLSREALDRLRRYLELLLRWNRRMSLTAIRDPRRAVSELFGESIFLASVLDLEGRLVDVGSGAGFPGLAVKLVADGLPVTLIESNRRKCSFLREVARECGFSSVSVVPDRFGTWQKKGEPGTIITTRAVDTKARFLDSLAGGLVDDGICAVFTTTDVVYRIKEQCICLRFDDGVPIPASRDRIILRGRKV